MSAMHTPGPWMVHPSYKRTLYVIPAIHSKRPAGGAADPEVDFNTYAQEVCALDSVDQHRSEGEMSANAYLIAAAPEGLDAAREALIALVAAPDSIAVQIARRKLNAFIAKATGSTP